MSQTRIKDIMTKEVIQLGFTEPLSKAIDLFEKHRISGLAICGESGDYVGVLTKTDLSSYRMLEYVQKNGSLENAKVSDFMNPTAPITVQEDAPLDNALEMMMHFKIHRVFVMNKDLEMVGVISTYDILSLMRYTCESYL